MSSERSLFETPEFQGAVPSVENPEKKRRRVLTGITAIIYASILAALLWKAYDFFWARHQYLITAYCDCPICINVKGFRDGKFASGRPVYWGGIAADKSIPFGAEIELVPVMPTDWLAVRGLLDGRKNFTVEDRGGKIRGRHFDIFFPQSMGGHQIAKQWGARRMRIKIDDRLMS